MKAIWKGYLKCSLVTIPIKMDNAIAKGSPAFSWCNLSCGAG